jgi:hypothetical protein
MRKRWFAVLALVSVFCVGGGILQAAPGGPGAACHGGPGAQTPHVTNPPAKK